MQPYRVLVIGGYGFFGSRLVERLARQPGLAITVAGRSMPSGQALVERLRPQAQATLHPAVLDIHASGFARDLQRLGPQAVVHTSGPFQGQDYRVAMACIACGAHYIDLADGRDFVAGITALDAPARQARLAVISGASSVPALSSAAVDHLAGGFGTLRAIDIGISPGNRTERGLSTVRAILGYCGQPLPGDGRRFGWVGTWRQCYPAPVGTRLLSPCDVPDLTLLPPRYAGYPAVRFGAGLELRWLHRGMNALALLVRWGWIADLSAHAGTLKRMADWFRHRGSDAGAMHVAVTGTPRAGGPATRGWQLLATGGDGPYVPTLAAAALVRQLCSGRLAFTGAAPCVGLLTLDDFVQECTGLQITMAPVSP